MFKQFIVQMNFISMAVLRRTFLVLLVVIVYTYVECIYVCLCVLNNKQHISLDKISPSKTKLEVTVKSNLKSSCHLYKNMFTDHIHPHTLSLSVYITNLRIKYDNLGINDNQPAVEY